MSLQKINKLKDEKGFTIVELLIVIVVIGILAAITIVAFNGVQQRARDTASKSDASSIVKYAEAFNAREGGTGGYPTLTSDFNATGIDAKLPANVTARIVTTSPTTAATAVTETSGVKSYATEVCSTNQGLKVWYAKGTGVDHLVAGSC